VHERLPEVAHIEIEGHQVVITHGHQFGYPTPAALAQNYPDAAMILFGHTHVPIIERVPRPDGGTILVVNPGSCGPRRSNLTPTLCLAEVTSAGIAVDLIHLGNR
jgi:predicted phosphodiesterase